MKSLPRLLSVFCLLAGSAAVATATPPSHQAEFVVAPEVVIAHTPDRSFIGPGTFRLENGDILMAAPWGRPPTNFEQLAATFPVSMLYRSTDGGRTWREQGRLKIEWPLKGMVSDGGISFLRLKDGRLAVVLHRHVQGLHGGGVPAISFSSDDGATWSAARMLIEEDAAYYVMNDRLIQLKSGRLLVPVSRKAGKHEGDKDESLGMLSDDGGASWRLSRGRARLEKPRGMQEPCAVELADGRVRLLARTGAGSIHTSISADGGETWSEPEPTTLESPCSSLTLRRAPDGRLVCLYNHATPLKEGAFFPRTPLVYALSSDDGATWSAPIVIDASGVEHLNRQNIYPSPCFTPEGMVVVWSTHGADPKGSFAGQYDEKIGGGKRAVIALPAR
jgi:sialidase-1